MKKIYLVILLGFLLGPIVGWGQTSYLGLDGGFEGSASIDNATLFATPQTGKWAKSTVTASIANEISTIRSGTNSLKVTSSSPTLCRVFSPQFTIPSSTTQWQIQYYRRATNITNTVANQTGNYRNGTQQANGTYTTVLTANSWEKVTYSPTSVVAATTSAAHILAIALGAGGDMFYDDFALYESVTIDNTAPGNPSGVATSSPTTSSLTVNWAAAGAPGVDGGGYLVVRGIADPTTAPNVNGIYAAGSLVAPGMVVVYNGTSTSFTDNSLAANTRYFYRVYTYDKAYNYSSSANFNDFTSAINSPEINIVGNLISIINNDLTPSITDNTDFGTTEVAGGNITKTFTIENTGSVNLNLTNASPFILITGAGAADFSVSVIPGNPIGAASSTTFQITFDPSAIGTRNATITIANDDINEASYIFNIQGIGLNSNTSDIIADPSYSYTSNIDYTLFQGNPVTTTANSVGSFKFTIRDGGASADADALSTELNAVTFSVANIANIRSAALFGGASQTTLINNAPVINMGAGIITFTGLSGINVTATDNLSQDITLRVSFLAAVTDNQQLQYSITSATANPANSLFASTNAGGAASSVTADFNRIEVTATKLVFQTQPTTISINATMTAPVVRALDANNNLDIDYVASITITSTGTMTGNPISLAATAGVATFSSVVHTVAITNRTITATSGSLTNTTSSNFNITDIVYFTGDYRSVGNGSWLSGGASTLWERFGTPLAGWNSGSNAPLYNTSNNVYIGTGTTISTGGSFGSSVNIKILQGGTFNCNSSGTTATMYVYSGGILNINASFTMATGGAFDVEDNGNVNVNFAYGTPTTSIWNGNENFRPASNFTFVDWDGANDILIIDNSTISPNLYNGYTAAFGNITCDFAANLGASDDMIFLATGVTINMAHGNLKFRTNSVVGADMRLSTNGIVTSGIGGNFLVDALYTSAGTQLINLKTSGTLIFTVKGNMQLDAATVRILPSSSTSSATLNIDGNLTLTSSAVLNFNSTVFAGASAIINLKGDLTLGSSSLFYNQNTSNLGQLNFAALGDGLTAATTQTIDIASTNASAQNDIAFTVNAGAYVHLINRDFQIGNNGALTVLGTLGNEGKFDFGYNGTSGWLVKERALQTGTSIFKVDVNGLIKITHQNGIISAPLLDGNVQLDNRLFDAAATYQYIGKQNQFTGDALPSSSSAKVLTCELATNTLTLTLSASTAFSSTATVDATYGGHLYIKKGQFIEGTSAYVTSSSGSLRMESGTYYLIAKGNNSAASSVADLIPRMSGSLASTYYLNGGTVELSSTGSGNEFQTLRGQRTYKNLKYSGTNTLGVNYKNLSSNAVVDESLTVSTSTVVDCVNTPGSAVSFTGNGGIIMPGGRIRFLNRSTTQPEMKGIFTPYNLAGGVMEFYAAAPGSNQTIQGKYGSPSTDLFYNQIEITGNTVGQGSANVTLRQDGIFTVKSTGVFETTSVAIVGPGNNETVVIENGGVFKCANPLGFNGSIVGFNSPSVRAGGAENIENITFNTGSTVEYSRADPQTPVDQTITKVISGGSEIAYQNISFTGTSTIGSIKTAPSTTLTVQGNMTKTGNSVFAHNGGTVLFNNTSATQTFTNTSILPFVFNNLTNSNTFSTGLSIANDLSIENRLLLTANSKLNVNTGNISMVSNSIKTAYVDQVAADAGISYGSTGKFIIERYIPAKRAWRLLTSPIGSGGQTINNSWMEGSTPNPNMDAQPTAGLYNTKPGYGTHISGGTTANFYDKNTTGKASVKYFDAAAATPAWKDLSILTPLNTQKVTDQRGYMLFVRGSRALDLTNGPSVAADVTTLRTNGQIILSNATPFSSPSLSGMQVVGNPFASAISFKQLASNNSLATADNKFYLWDPYLAGSNGVGAWVTLAYRTIDGLYDRTVTILNDYNPAGGIDNAGTIQSGAAFMMDFGASARTITFAENIKVTTSTNLVFRPTRQIRTNLAAVNPDNSIAALDGVLNTFGAGDINEVDGLDINKISNFSENLSISRQAKSIAIERRALLNETDTIFYGIAQMKLRKYLLEFAPDSLADNNLLAFLEDAHLKKSTPVSLIDTTRIEFEVNAANESYSANRFRLVFKKSIQYSSIHAFAINKDIDVEWKLSTEINVKTHEVERSTDGISFIKVGEKQAAKTDEATYNHLDEKPTPGIYYYRIKSISNSGAISYSELAKVTLMNTKGSLYVYPNPVSNGSIGLQMNSTPAGAYSLRLLNSAGQSIVAKTVNHTGGTASVNIQYPAQLTGHYQLEITGANEKKTVLKVVIQ